MVSHEPQLSLHGPPESQQDSFSQCCSCKPILCACDAASWPQQLAWLLCCPAWSWAQHCWVHWQMALQLLQHSCPLQLLWMPPVWQLPAPTSCLIQCNSDLRKAHTIMLLVTLELCTLLQEVAT